MLTVPSCLKLNVIKDTSFKSHCLLSLILKHKVMVSFIYKNKNQTLVLKIFVIPQTCSIRSVCH